LIKLWGLLKNTISVRKGFNKVVELTGLEGRWQKFYSNPTCICDTGHNVGGWQYISEQLKSQKCRNLRIVFGMVDDKDINAVMDMLPKDAIYYFTRPSSKRAFLESSVYNLGINKGLKGNCFHSVDIAFNCALSDSNEDDFIFVGGSSYIVADLLSFIKSK
jgi:dihydrofolate synthase/folylpolyglutamate synthase